MIRQFKAKISAIKGIYLRLRKQPANVKVILAIVMIFALWQGAYLSLKLSASLAILGDWDLIPVMGQATSSPLPSRTKAEWQPIETLLASTPQRRLKAAQQLGIEEGEYILALLSIHCGDCDRIAQQLQQRAAHHRIIAVAVAEHDQAAIDEWKKGLGLSITVVGINQQAFNDLGAVLLPTLVKLENGKAVGVAENCEVLR